MTMATMGRRIKNLDMGYLPAGSLVGGRRPRRPPGLVRAHRQRLLCSFCRLSVITRSCQAARPLSMIQSLPVLRAKLHVDDMYLVVWADRVDLLQFLAVPERRPAAPEVRCGDFGLRLIRARTVRDEEHYRDWETTPRCGWRPSADSSGGRQTRCVPCADTVCRLARVRVRGTSDLLLSRSPPTWRARVVSARYSASLMEK